MKPCRECRHPVSEQAPACPGCGAPYPARDRRDGWGFEYKSAATVLGWPLVHVSFKFRPNYLPVPARGILAIGQFALGVVNISQFGIGIFSLSLSPFTVSVYALAQFALAGSLIAQFGLYADPGYGPVVRRRADLLAGP